MTRNKKTPFKRARKKKLSFLHEQRAGSSNCELDNPTDYEQLLNNELEFYEDEKLK